MTNFIRALITCFVLVLIFLSEIASGKRVEAHIIAKRYWQPDFVLGNGPTQSMIIIQNGSSNAGIGCKLAFRIRLSYHLTSVTV